MTFYTVSFFFLFTAIPDFAAHILFELHHDNRTGQYFVEMEYNDQVTDSTSEREESTQILCRTLSFLGAMIHVLSTSSNSMNRGRETTECSDRHREER